MTEASLEKRTNQWAMFLHLSFFLGWIIPFAGLVAPIVIWQMKKEELPGIDAHGKNVVNFIISFFLWGVVCFVLTFIVIGVFLAIILAVLAIAFPIIAAIKANAGETWRYPLTLTLLK